MIITFCGHSNFIESNDMEKKLLSILTESVGDSQADLYLGGYGSFDAFALKCAKKFKASHPDTNLFFITPYITENYQKNRLQQMAREYDAIIYPDIENVPPRFAITYRNKYMVEKSDIVIAYITHTWGGAYQTYKYAKRKRKRIINISNTDKKTDR